jgi:hypothetical protein
MRIAYLDESGVGDPQKEPQSIVGNMPAKSCGNEGGGSLRGNDENRIAVLATEDLRPVNCLTIALSACSSASQTLVDSQRRTMAVTRSGVGLSNC